MKKESSNTGEESQDILRAPAEHVFRAFLDQTPDRIYIKDLKSRFVMVSRTMLQVFEADREEEVVGKTDFDFFTQEHARQAFEDEQEILRTGRPIISKEEKETWTDGSETWASSTKAPLFLSSGQIVGLLGISRDITEHRRSEQKVREQNEIMSRDLESARNVQSVMIPGDIPRHPRVKTAVWLRPMAAVGGDFVTYPDDPEGRLLFFMGDVAGHSISAALFTVLIKYLSDRRGEHYSGDPRDFLNRVNEGLARRIPDGFITGLCGHFEENEEGVDLCMSNAGHREVFVLRKENAEPERAELKSGVVLGLDLDSASPVDRIRLTGGDRVYAFTDGLVEARNRAGEEYGVERLLAALGKFGKSELRASLDLLGTEVNRFREGLDQQDDISMVAFEVKT